MMIKNIWLFGIAIWRLIENFLNSLFEWEDGTRVLLVFCFIFNMQKHSFFTDCICNFLNADSRITMHAFFLVFVFFPKQCWKSLVPPILITAALQPNGFYGSNLEFISKYPYLTARPNFFVVCFGWNRKSVFFSFFSKL